MQRATTSHNEPQLPTIRHKMNKTGKKLHSLVYALSPLNPLTAGILIKIVLMLVPRVRSARCHLPAPVTHAMFRHYSVSGRCIWKRFRAHNIIDLAVKGLSTNLLQNLFSAFVFSFSSLENLGRNKDKAFYIARKLLKVLLHFGTDHLLLGVCL